MYFRVSKLTSARLYMIFAALKWIRSTLCSNAGEQVPHTNMPYVALGTMLRNKWLPGPSWVVPSTALDI